MYTTMKKALVVNLLLSGAMMGAMDPADVRRKSEDATCRTDLEQKEEKAKSEQWHVAPTAMQRIFRTGSDWLFGNSLISPLITNRYAQQPKTKEERELLRESLIRVQTVCGEVALQGGISHGTVRGMSILCLNSELREQYPAGMVRLGHLFINPDRISSVMRKDIALLLTQREGAFHEQALMGQYGLTAFGGVGSLFTYFRSRQPQQSSGVSTTKALVMTFGGVTAGIVGYKYAQNHHKKELDAVEESLSVSCKALTGLTRAKIKRSETCTYAWEFLKATRKGLTEQADCLYQGKEADSLDTIFKRIKRHTALQTGKIKFRLAVNKLRFSLKAKRNASSLTHLNQRFELARLYCENMDSNHKQAAMHSMMKEKRVSPGSHYDNEGTRIQILQEQARQKLTPEQRKAEEEVRRKLYA